MILGTVIARSGSSSINGDTLFGANGGNRLSTYVLFADERAFPIHARSLCC